MPIKSCQIRGKSGFKWGSEGKCYTGPNAKQKAIKQGIAIEGGKFGIEKISFDFDGTISKKTIQEKAAKLIAEGNLVYIISARHYAGGIFKIADQLGIPHSRVFATGSNKAKIEMIKSLGIMKHFDDNGDVIDALKEIDIKGIKV